MKELVEILTTSYSRNELIAIMAQIQVAIELVWTILTFMFLFLMQAGLVFMATGAARKKNKTSILTSHIIIICVSAIIFIFLSNHLTLGAQGGLLGTQVDYLNKEFTMMDAESLYYIYKMLDTFTKVLTCATIACIQLQERVLIETFIIMSFVVSGVIAPVGFAWIRGDGWLERIGFHDSTCSSIMFMCGGFCGLTGNIMLGPRLSVFEKLNGHVLTKNNIGMKRLIEKKKK